MARALRDRAPPGCREERGGAQRQSTDYTDYGRYPDEFQLLPRTGESIKRLLGT